MNRDKSAFSEKLDRAAFWVASLSALVVYFFTLGPSVGLEDSGELATAGAHLGVPHPPGYPFWTLCAWIFCKAFSFVTYMGHPTPAWAISLCSAVFGAFASGCTAMLICRSARDMLSETGGGDGSARGTDLLCFAGGVGGALAFAFSPVEWSQSTIVEIYSLNALFLMWVFLLSYRWMKKPGDKLLWATAFVFGLGLTNYQVLLFAIVPIAIIICLRNFAMFRDFFLFMIPVALTYQVLKIGDLNRASELMQSDAINKHEALMTAAGCPATWAVALGLAVAVGTLVAAQIAKRRSGTEKAVRVLAAGGGAAAAILLLAALGVLSQNGDWTVAGTNPATGRREAVASATAPLVNPKIYVWIAMFLLGSVFSAVAARFKSLAGGREGAARRFLWASAALALLAAAVAVASVPAADSAGYAGEEFPWAKSTAMFALLAALLVGASLFVKDGLAFSIPVAGFHIVLFILLRRGAMNGLVHPCSWWFWWPLAWNFIVLALAWIVLPYGKSVAGAALFAQLGVSFYAYMPIVSDIRNPPMNWGYPRTWEGFKHAITRGQYEAITLPDFPNAKAFFEFLGKQLGHYFSDVKTQFSDFLVFFAFVPFSLWRGAVRLSGGRVFRFRALHAVECALAVLLLRAAMQLCGLSGGKVLLVFDRVVIGAMAAVSAAGVLVIAFNQIVRPVWLWAKRLAGLNGAAADGEAGDVKEAAVRIAFESPDVSQQWLLASGACFFMMSVPLILLAQVKGDLQDGFIQKVKFISSHAMVALWIGYGLAIVACEAYKALAAKKRGAKAAAWLLAAAAVLCPSVTPVVQNWTDPEIAIRFGGSEQNGHTFGWQFGAFQLEGAKAVREMLSPDEEPLPDPDWPPPMDPYSIFFGGTDPGRFVPTYMIYAANYRPDVYLITQNALADDTYMSVERDLYGDEIWIPSKEDSGEAFNIYVDEVKRGVRPANGDLRIENGRVQVTGALGVMEINGILAKMMFEHDRKRHSFYVEESYAIQWMYPYLSPHGLIMKLNAEKTPYDRATARKDRDFWAWYSKRLMNDPAYRRDFAGQKSFSKLRAAIAGLYRTQGRIEDALAAFREAHLLYPASPEASFRYISELLIPLDRTGVVKELIDHTDRLDPNNTRTARIRAYVETREKIGRLEARFRAGTQTREDAIGLAAAYRASGRMRDAAALYSQLLPLLSSREELFTAAAVLSATGDFENALKALDRHAAMPGRTDPAALAMSAAARFALGRRREAMREIERLERLDAALAADTLQGFLSKDGRGEGDFDVLLKLAKLHRRAGRRRAAMQAFANAYMLNPERADMERSRDRELGATARDIMIEQQQRRR